MNKYLVGDQTVWVISTTHLGKFSFSFVISKISKKMDNSVWILPGLYVSDNTLKQMKVIGIRFLRYNVGLTIHDKTPDQSNGVEF